MKAKLGFVLALALPLGAAAQGFDSGPCYSWEGGHKSAGSFSKCPQGIPPAKPAVVAMPVAPAPAIAPSPIMMPMTCPPPQTPIVKKKRPAPKKC